MLHSRDLDVDEPEEGVEPTDLKATNVTLADRSSPRWAVVLGVSFGLAIHACTLGLFVLSLLFHSIVVQGGESRMASVLMVSGLCLIAGMALLEFAHSVSLKGFRWVREKLAKKLSAMLALPIALTIFFVHPLAGLTIPVCAGLGLFFQWRLSRAKTNEAPWIYLPEEAVSLFAGRDASGIAQATMVSPNHALNLPLRRIMVWMAVLMSVAIGSYLISQLVLTASVMMPLVLISGWCVSDVLKFTETLFSREKEDHGKTTQVLKSDGPVSLPGAGLLVSGLNVRSLSGETLLADITMSIDPGEIVGIIGESGSGKSLLMKSLVDPFSLAGVQASGRVTLNGIDLWQRSSTHQNTPAVLVADTPIIMPVSGADNLSCFQGEEQLKRGQYYLEQMVFAHDLVHEICDTPDASLLPSMQRKALALSRAFALSPSAYFLDRPEDALQASQISALGHRFDHEVRMGRSIVLISDNRALLDKCDRLFVLQNGTLVDFGPAQQVRERRASGWHRFIARRELDAEENLEKWVRSHFRRDGDEANRRRASQVASELLAISCREASQNSDESVEFLFKNFEGHCIVQLIDSSPPISSGQIQKAQELIAAKPLDSRRNPLAAILNICLEVEFESHLDGRLIKAKVETYDPRKTEAKSGKVNAQTSK